ncbi:Hpt domain-containing protein [Sulfurimonas marina]|uniref:Hpt domain-containing protein n=1 Tax=Sulfurimonas marina TaxID=2590551 RepID=A0A7M1AWV4_9BACT|nr:Hpt domain-containing protein [Sulfurimonas marina]QOP41933.1 Hpt domain-containing protein [Sulfurimonas marina]
MLIYNYKKEFIGIDEKDLKTLGVEDLAQLRSEAADFADLFVKTPGYVHNFQHVHWIDYIACADSTEQPKVIINAKGNLFKADVSIATCYLADNPVEKGYLVNLNHLRVLTDTEKSTVSGDLLEKHPSPAAAEIEPIHFETVTTPTKPQTPVTEEVLEDEYDTHAIEETTPAHEEHHKPLDVGDLSVDDVVDEAFDLHPELAPKEEAPAPEDIIETPEPSLVEETVPEIIEQPAATQRAKHKELDPELEKAIHSDYVYNPQIASDELGLPLDLIEEFIEDFINQAKEFKPNLYNALDEGDIDNVKILSHKLKGVAANLRIEDALEVLTTVNTTSDLSIIKRNLDIFYIIIAKLAGEEINLDEPAVEDEELILDFKDEPNDSFETPEEISIADEEITIADADVPEQIEIPELADDNFVAQDDMPIEFDNDLDADKLEVELDEPLSLDEPISSKAFDKDSIAQEIGLDSESFNELLDDFSGESKEILANIKNGIQNSDLDIAKGQLRQLKSMSDNIRFSELSNELQQLLDSDSTDEISIALTKVEELLQQISTED